MVDQSISNFESARFVLSKYIPASYGAGSVYNLDRITKLLAFLDNPQEKFKIIHVAGTSGKTSTAYYCASLLKAAGHKVGLTVSPHVDEVNERVQIDLVPLDEQTFCRELSSFVDLVEKSGTKPTYYELLVAFAYYQFAKNQVDYAVVEVGLGGLLDGTNTIQRVDKLCVITDIGFDHTGVLGKTLSEIAAQKAGIIQHGNEIFMHRQKAEVVQAVRKRIAEVGATMHLVDASAVIQRGLPAFQNRNFALAYQVVSRARTRDGLTPLAIETIGEAARIVIPARMEVFEKKGTILVVDGSHNGQKMHALVTSLRERYPDRSFAALVAFVSADDERWRQALRELAAITDNLVVTSFSGGQDMPRAAISTGEIVSEAKKAGFSQITDILDPVQAYRVLRNIRADVHLVAGSFYLLKYIRPLVIEEFDHD